MNEQVIFKDYDFKRSWILQMILLDSLTIFLHFQFASEYKDQ